jgi:hypothetical protein
VDDAAVKPEQQQNVEVAGPSSDMAPKPAQGPCIDNGCSCDAQSLTRRTILARMAAVIPAAAATAPLAAAEHGAPELAELLERWQAERAARVSLDPASWVIGPIINGRSYSPGMPLHPSPEVRGWSFPFPQADGVHYVSTPITPRALVPGSTVRMAFAIVGDAKFAATEGDAPARVRLFLQRRGDTWNREYYRWWSVAYVDLGIGSYILAADLTGQQWLSVYGKRGEDPEPAQGFAAALADVANIGMTFGGTFAGHGVYATGQAKFVLKDYALVP